MNINIKLFQLKVHINTKMGINNAWEQWLDYVPKPAHKHFPFTMLVLLISHDMIV